MIHWFCKQKSATISKRNRNAHLTKQNSINTLKKLEQPSNHYTEFCYLFN